MGQMKPSLGYYRRLTAADQPQFEAHLLRLDAESRRNRFGGAVSETFLRDYAARAFALDGVIFGYVEDGELRAAGELRVLTDDVEREAEAAFSVEADWRRRGVASGLFQRIIDAARNRRIKRILVICLPNNQGMRALTRKFDGDIERLGADMLGVVTTPRANLFSRWREMADDAVGFAAAIFETQRTLANLSPLRARRRALESKSEERERLSA